MQAMQELDVVVAVVVAVVVDGMFHCVTWRVQVEYLSCLL